MGGGREYQVIPSKMFMSQSDEKVCGVTLQCFRKFLVWKKIYGGEMGGLFFSSKIFSLTVPNNSVGEPFNVSAI